MLGHSLLNSSNVCNFFAPLGYSISGPVRRNCIEFNVELPPGEDIAVEPDSFRA
jgi:hypothetical protein